MHNRIYLDTNILLDLLVDENKFADYSKVKAKDLPMIKALEGVLYEQKGEYWTFDEVKKMIKGE